MAAALTFLSTAPPTPAGAAQTVDLETVIELPTLTERHADMLRLYWAFFLRDPDASGALYWLERQERCDPLAPIADYFATSEEFDIRYGQATTTEEFVAIVYGNVLGRSTDDRGAAYWVERLGSGQLSRGEMVLYVAQSPEFESAHPYPSDGVANRSCSLPAGRPTPRTATFGVTEAVTGVAGLNLASPGQVVEYVGFHQSTHDGAQQFTTLPVDLAWGTMASRGRGTGSRTAVDVAVNPLLPVQSPVAGTVKRAGTYTLYCRYTDEFVVITPDANPVWEVKLLHLIGLYVQPGDRVEGGEPVAQSARTLPLTSQIDAKTASPSWPHVHLEIVDSRIPGRPSGGC